MIWDREVLQLITREYMRWLLLLDLRKEVSRLIHHVSSINSNNTHYTDTNNVQSVVDILC